MTYTLIDSVTLGANAASVTFSSIPQTYGDLVCVSEVKGTAATDTRAKINGDTGSNYSRVYAAGNGSSASTYANTLPFLVLQSVPNATATVAQLCNTQIFDYSATDKHKSILIRVGAGTGTEMSAARWASTAAITTLEIYSTNGPFAAGATLNLYGIAKAL